MINVEASDTVHASVASVRRVLSHVEAWPTWTATMSAVHGRDGSALKLGASFDIRQPRLRPANWIFTALDPPRQSQWTSRMHGLCVQADHEVQAAGAAACQVLLGVRFTGLLAPFAGRLTRAPTRAHLEQECAALKAVVEGKPQ